ncbi:muellerian-inhibiting factor [Triplophysa dalaica]|uniref:muellerian-inhibiting factor n=1 Tax=Triplophysa dalaica TaxID=1582913 RepID=UPI0024E0158A|nr:muellerian-inhibiting factor [Triplophysa dalaica]
MESEKMLVQARICLMLLLGLTGSYSATVGHAEQDVVQVMTPSGHDEEGDVRHAAHLPKIVAEHPIDPPAHSAHATEEVLCHDKQTASYDAVDDFLSALNHGSELGSTELQRFGICSQHDAIRDLQVTALTQLTERVRQQQNGIKGVQATEVDVWEAEKEEEIILALKFPRFIHPTSPFSLMLLFNVGSIEADDLTIVFNSHFLHPNTQTVCISESTRFLVLTGRQRESHSHTHLKLRVKVDTLKAVHGKKLSLSDLQEILMRKVNDSNITMKPTLLFLAEKGQSESASPFKYPSPLPPSKTFLFLCELQKFLKDVLPQKNAPESQEEESTSSLYALNSLPSLTLGKSSPQFLLSGLVNSSTQTLFVFPPHQQRLQTHRVELNLESPLLFVLRLRLDEAIAQVKKEEAAHKVIYRLQRLIEMSALPPEGTNEEAVTIEHKEAQYRSVLLLKALQTVLSILEVERGQRAARADEDSQATSQQCRLQSLIVSLRKYTLEPSVAKINNCEGSCSFPLSTTSNNHVVLLNSHIQSGHPVNRSPCCVPVEYDDLCVIELESKATVTSFKPKVVATKCECR